MLEIHNLSVAIGGTLVLEKINLTLPDGELHVLLGPNGSGKSSLLATIMGLPPFEVVEGEILFDGSEIQRLGIRERAMLGIGLAYQRPPALDGVSVLSFAKAMGVADGLAEQAAALDLADFVDRDLNVGFSGGEIKRWEVLKLILQGPRLMLFDEPESGVDLEHVNTIGDAVRKAVRRPDPDGKPRSGLIITHTGLILNHVDADRGHIMKAGKILHSGDPREIFDHIQSEGYSVPEPA